MTVSVTHWIFITKVRQLNEKQLNLLRDKRNSIIASVRETEAAANSNDFVTGGKARKPFNGPVGNISSTMISCWKDGNSISQYSGSSTSCEMANHRKI